MRDRLISLMYSQFSELYKDIDWNFYEMLSGVADYLLKNGVIVAPMPMADWLRQELAEYVHRRCLEELWKQRI